MSADKKEFRVKHDVDQCVGCGICVRICPENWVIIDNKAKPKKTVLNNEELEKNSEAAKDCPTQAIEIESLLIS